MGFSQNVGRPASTAWRMRSAWVIVGEVIDDRIHGREQRLDRGRRAAAHVPGDRLRPVEVGIGHQHLLHFGVAGEDAGVERSDPADADDADAHVGSS